MRIQPVLQVKRPPSSLPRIETMAKAANAADGTPITQRRSLSAAAML
jgi:hypothetical protein